MFDAFMRLRLWAACLQMASALNRSDTVAHRVAVCIMLYLRGLLVGDTPFA